MWGTKTSKFHDLWIFDPGEPLFMDLNIQKHFNEYKKLWTHKKTMFINLKRLERIKTKHFVGPDLEKMGTDK